MAKEMTRAAVVNLVNSWEGLKESDGSHKKIVDIYNSYKGPFPRGLKMKYSWSWCACTWSALAIKLGYTSIMPIEISCYYLIEAAKKMGIWIEDDVHVPNIGEAVLYYWKDGEYNYLNLEEPAADVAIYYPVITDIQQAGGDFYYMGFCPSANGIVAAGWKNEKLLFNSRDTVKPAGVLPKGMIVDNQDCYWLFVKGRYTVLYKNNEIIHYFGEKELMDVDPSLSYVPLGIYKDGDDFYYAIVRSSNTVSQISNKSIMIYKGYEELFRITGLTQCVQVKDGTVYTLINRGNNAVFYENENAIYSFSIEKNRCHNFILYEE